MVLVIINSKEILEILKNKFKDSFSNGRPQIKIHILKVERWGFCKLKRTKHVDNLGQNIVTYYSFTPDNGDYPEFTMELEVGEDETKSF